MSDLSTKFEMGWLPDYPDFRDHKVDNDIIPQRLLNIGQTDSINTMIEKVGLYKKEGEVTPVSVDLVQWFSPVEDQDSFGTCTANASVPLVEYFEKKSFNKHVDASRLFLYRATRILMKKKGDNGAFLRNTMGEIKVIAGFHTIICCMGWLLTGGRCLKMNGSIWGT